MSGRILILVGALVVGVAIALVVMTRTPAPAPPPPPPPPPRQLDATAYAPPIAQAADALVADAALIDAASARGERQQVLAGLVASGAGAEAWDAQGTALLDSLAHRGVEMTDAACFVAGCGATFTFPNEADYRRRIDELQSSDAYRAWTGGKRMTAPELGADGRVTIAVALYRPD